VSQQQLIAPTTAAASVQYNASEADKVIFSTCGAALASNAETVLIQIIDSTGVAVNTYNDIQNNVNATLALAAGSTPAKLQGPGGGGATFASLRCEGGVTYLLTKSVTAGAVGVDVNSKPRVGP
jgi:hypothetical protein